MRLPLALGMVLAGISAPAQAEMKLQPMKTVPYVNDSGFRITSFAVQASPTGCEGAQAYEHTTDTQNKGRSPLVWSSSKAMQGGVACKGGMWLYGSGPKQGQRGGKMGDLFVRNGQYFWIAGY